MPFFFCSDTRGFLNKLHLHNKKLIEIIVFLLLFQVSANQFIRIRKFFVHYFFFFYIDLFFSSCIEKENSIKSPPKVFFRSEFISLKRKRNFNKKSTKKSFFHGSTKEKEKLHVEHQKFFSWKHKRKRKTPC
jgi:hypothetical protein